MLCLRKDGQKRPPWLLRLRSSTTFIIATAWMSSFTDYLLYAMIVPVMPTALVERVGVPYEDREYWVSVLLSCEAGVAFICCPIFGYVIDISPRRQLPFLFGLIMLGGSMGTLAVARTMWLFIVARLLQGSATAVVSVASLALIADSVPFDSLGQSIGYLGSAIAFGFMLGPFLGGLIYDTAGYHAVFIAASAIIAVDLFMRIAMIEKKVARVWMSDTESEDNHETLANRLASSRSRRNPALWLIAKQPRVLISSWAFLVQGLYFSAFDATIPVFVESRFAWSPFKAGLTFLPSAMTALLEPLFGYISDRYGNRLVTFTSFCLLSPPLIGLGFLGQNTTLHHILLITLVAVTGLMASSCIPALYVETQQVLEEMERAKPGIFGKKGAVAQAFGIQTMSQFLGLFLGPLWGGFVEYRFGWKVMTWSLAVLVACTAVPMMWLSTGDLAEGVVVEDSSSDEEEERVRLLADEPA